MPIAVWVFALGWAFVGAVLGIGLNRVIYQLPHDAPAFATPRCASCAHPIPTLGRPGGGRCQQCGAPLGYDRVDLVIGGLFFLLALYYGLTSTTLVYSLYTAVLVVVAAIDARHRYVYAIVTYPAILAAVLLTPTLPGATLFTPLVGLAIGGGVFLAFYVLGRLLYRGVEPMATGDITIAAMVGAMVGFPRVVAALFIGSVASALLGVVVVLWLRSGRRTFVPYGPGLCAGAIAGFFIPA